MRSEAEVRAREAYSVGYVAFGYNQVLRCWRCGEKILSNEPVFHVSKFDANGDLTISDYHLRCAPKRKMKRVLKEMERVLGSGGGE